MSIIVCFTLLEILAFIVYMSLRLIKKRNPLNLAALCLQVFAATWGALSYMDGIDLLVDNNFETFFVLLGIILPAGFLAYDFVEMKRKLDKCRSVHERLEGGTAEKSTSGQAEAANNAVNESFLKYYNLGMDFFKDGNFRDAVESFRYARKLKPEEVEVCVHLGNALVQERKYNEAIEAYKIAINGSRDSGELYYSISSVYAMINNPDIAMDNLKKAVELNPDIKKKASSSEIFLTLRGIKEFRELVS